MPGVSDHAGSPERLRWRTQSCCLPLCNSVGTRDKSSIVAQWLACTYPYRRFACTLADACARLGADVVRYTFIAVDLHPLLLAGLPAHGKRLSALRRPSGYADMALPTPPAGGERAREVGIVRGTAGSSAARRAVDTDAASHRASEYAPERPP